MNIIHSHSALQRYVNCPFQYNEVVVAKRVKDTQSKAGAYGEQMHKAVEMRVGNGTPLPPNFAHYERVAAAVVDIPGEKHAELKLGVREDLSPCEFWDKSGWFRGIVDLLILRGDHGLVIDWKTGKYRGSDDQEKRCAALVFAHFPQLQSISSRFIYLKEGHIAKETFWRDDMDSLVQSARSTAADIEESARCGKWVKRPSGLCGWCPVQHCPNWRENKRK